jgi:hypothetical protein
MRKSPGLDTGALPFEEEDVLAVADSLLDPSFHFFCDPRYSTGTKLYPLGEFTGDFEPRDVRETVGDTVDRLEFLL